MDWTIKNITDERGLDDAIAFAARFFPDYGKGQRGLWSKRLAAHPELLLYAEIDGEIAAAVFGYEDDNGNITIEPVATDAPYRKLGIARALLAELERRAKSAGYDLLALGAVREAEGFYISCGFTPFLFVQDSFPVTLDDLRGVNPGFPEAWTYDDGTDVRLMLRTNGINRALQGIYDAAFPTCSTQTVFTKSIL